MQRPMSRAAPGLHLPRELAAGLITRARGAAGHEICGLLTGAEAGRAGHDLTIANRATRAADRFQMDIGQQIEAFRATRRAGHVIVAIYHSHPVGEAVPSGHDRRGHGYPAIPAIIVAPGAEADVIRAWWLEPGSAAECPLIIEPAEHAAFL